MFSVAAFQALQLVTNRLPGALSPKLKRFVWPACSSEWLIGEDLHSVFLSSCVSLFLTKSVECFEIRSYSDNDTPVGIMSLNHALENLDPSILKALSLDDDEMHPVVRSSIETVRWRQLEQVEIHGNAGVLPMLGCLPSLSRLRLSLPDDSYELEEQTLPASYASRPNSSFSAIPHSSFPCLTNFHLSTSGKPAGVLDALRCFPQGNAIKELQLTGYESSFPTAGALFDTLRSHMNPSNLQSLTWTEKPSYGMVRWQRDPSPSEFDANPAIDISPLFPFKHLKSLEISIDKNICLTRAEASQIPTCWPEIRDLKLWCHSWRDVAVIDHTDILSILRGCPGLKSLALRFDASTITGDELGPTTSAFRLHSLLLDGDIPISSPSRVLQFLQTVFSTQHLILSFVEGGLQNRETLLFQQRWKLVEERWIDACEDRV
ncbi:hypothetical protein D9611_013788 [Ephemerocybe angulata]|uniref:Uncharacterized protein n=1 Tax=Ephemerocybe angulata TaxID=980116 RepID=A0A8H5C5V3_9AGAR|nr:hypothetical protein D9611_013788 [Tulosesus angulatus]